MGEMALGWGLRLLGIALFVGPLIAAFAAHGWDLQATVMPSQAEMDEIKGMLGGMPGGESPENTITVENYQVGATESKATVRFKSPLKFPIKITDLSGYATCGEHPGVRLGPIRIDQSVEIPAQENRTFDVIVGLTWEGINHIAFSHGGNQPDSLGFENARATIELYGVVVQLQLAKR